MRTLTAFLCLAMAGCQSSAQQRMNQYAADTRPYLDRPVTDLAKSLNRVPRSAITGSDGTRRYTFTLQGGAYGIPEPGIIAPMRSCDLIVDTDARGVVRSATVNGLC